MNSPFPWPGGKRALKKTLLSLLPPHEIYVEVFAGSAKLLFAKEPSLYEVMNDVNGDVTNFFRVAKHRAAELAERFAAEIIHAERFRDLRAETAQRCEIDRALRFAYLVWYSFGAKGEHFAMTSATSPQTRRPLDMVRDLLDATAARLQRVMIQQRDFAEILARYDDPATFFYLDPPYVDYQDNGRYQPLTTERRAELFAQLAAMKGKFLLSFDDVAEVRRLARTHGFHVRQVKVGYTLGHTPASRKTQSSELLIANYPLAQGGSQPVASSHRSACA